MSLTLYPEIALSPGLLSLFIAPPQHIREALNTMLRRHRDHVLYLSGNYPVILPDISSHEKMQVRRALTVYQISTILEEADESLILIEHDRSLYDENPEFTQQIVETCRQKASDNTMVCIVALRMDRWLLKFEPYTNRFVYLMSETQNPRKINLKADQTTLKGIC